MKDVFPVETNKRWVEVRAFQTSASRDMYASVDSQKLLDNSRKNAVEGDVLTIEMSTRTGLINWILAHEDFYLAFVLNEEGKKPKYTKDFQKAKTFLQM